MVPRELGSQEPGVAVEPGGGSGRLQRQCTRAHGIGITAPQKKSEGEWGEEFSNICELLDIVCTRILILSTKAASDRIRHAYLNGGHVNAACSVAVLCLHLAALYLAAPV